MGERTVTQLSESDLANEPNEEGVEGQEGEDQEEQSEHTETDESVDTEQESEEEADKQTEQKEDEFESEEEFLARHKLPGSPKTIDEMVESYKALLENRNRDSERESLRRDDAPLKETIRQSKNEGYYPRNLVTSVVQSMLETMPEEQRGATKFWANTIDKALTPLIEGVEQTQNEIVRGLQAVIGQVREDNWRRFQFKHAIQRDKLDDALKQIGGFDYTKAFQYLAVSDPKLLAEFAEAQRKVGAKKEQARKLKRFSSVKRGGQRDTTPTDQGYSKYLDAEGNLDETKLSMIPDPTGQRVRKIAEAYTRDLETKRK